MKWFNFLQIFIILLLARNYRSESKNLLSYFKYLVNSKYEELSANYDNFIYLINSLKNAYIEAQKRNENSLHNDDYSEEKKIIVKKDPRTFNLSKKIDEKRLLQGSNSTTKCNALSFSMNATENIFYCNSTVVSESSYSSYSKFSYNKCEIKSNTISLCICPKDFYGERCYQQRRTACKFKSLFVNGLNLLYRYNTFYDEYLNNNRSVNFDKNTLLNFTANINCVTAKAINETFYDSNPLSNIVLDKNKYQNLKFNYEINSKGVVFSKFPNLNLIFRIYDMNSLMPKIELKLPFTNSSLGDILSGRSNVSFPISYSILSNLSSIDPFSLLIAGRLFFEIDLVDQKSGLVDFMHVHSALNVYDAFPLNSRFSNTIKIVIIVISILVFIIAVAIIYYLYKRKRVKNTGEFQNQNNQLIFN